MIQACVREVAYIWFAPTDPPTLKRVGSSIRRGWNGIHDKSRQMISVNGRPQVNLWV